AHTAAAMGRYGRQLGIAFQITDDALDYGRGDSDYGKEAGDDLAEGKATLPLIRAMQHLPEQDAERMRRAIRDGDIKQLDFVVAAIESTQAMAYTWALADDAARKATRCLDELDPSVERESLAALADFAVARRY